MSLPASMTVRGASQRARRPAPIDNPCAACRDVMFCCAHGHCVRARLGLPTDKPTAARNFAAGVPVDHALHDKGPTPIGNGRRTKARARIERETEIRVQIAEQRRAGSDDEDERRRRSKENQDRYRERNRDKLRARALARRNANIEESRARCREAARKYRAEAKAAGLTLNEYLAQRRAQREGKTT